MQKQQIFAQMRERYAVLKATRWEGYSGYDNWFDKPLNNARLALAATYNDYVSSFAQLFRQAGEDFPIFYQLARALADLPRERREIKLRELVARPAVRATDLLSAISGPPP